MSKNENRVKKNLELITRAEACEILGMSHPTFFRYYAKSLTTYENADDPKDKRHFFIRKEVEEMHERRRRKKEEVPKNVVIKRLANDNE